MWLHKIHNRVRGNLKLVLVFQVGLPVLLLLAGVLALTLTLFSEMTEERLQRELRQVARAIRLPVTQALESRDLVQLNSSLESIFDINEVYGAYLFDKTGKRLITLGSVLPTREQASLAIEQTLEGEFDQYENIRGRDVYSFFMPLFDDAGRPSGLLQVTRKRSDIEHELSELRLWSWLGLAMVSLLVTLVLMYAHRRAIGQPLSRLLQSMQQVEAGQQSHRAECIGPDEVRQLALGMNRMLDSIQLAEQQAKAQHKVQEQMAEKLLQAQTLAALGQLSAGVAHELGAPLSVIDGRAQRLLRRQSADESSRELHDIRDQVERMSAIIRQLLSYGRSSRNERRRLDVGLLVESCVGQSDQDGLQTRIEPGPPLQVYSDPLSMEQLLLNLLRNAWQAAPSGPVAIRWQQGESGRVHIQVEDAGPGIPEDQRERVLEPFVSSKSPGEGSGLGLAIVDRIMREHHGELRIGSSRWGGALIELIFPAINNEEGES